MAHTDGQLQTLRTVVRLEWRILAADSSVRWILAAFGLFLVYAVWTGWRGADAHEQGLAAAVANAEEPAALAVLPPVPLAAVTTGQRDLHPQAIQVSAGSSISTLEFTGSAMSGPTRQATGAFDLAFVFVVLLPFVIIALTYDVLSGERERGTLAMVLSQPVSLNAFVGGKALVRAVVVILATVLFGALALIPAGGDLFSADGLLRSGLYFFVLGAYAAFWFAAALAVNARGGTSAGNALALVGLWLALVVLVPGLVRVAVEVAYPPPSRVELVNHQREVAREIESELDDMEGRHGAEAERERQFKSARERAAAVEDALAKQTAPVIQEFRETLASQQALVDAVRFVSPAIVLQEALAELAGTGASRQQRFEQQVDTFHQRWRTHHRATIAADGDAGPPPTFSYADESLGSLALRVGAGLLGLLVPGLILLLWSLAVFRGAGLRAVTRC